MIKLELESTTKVFPRLPSVHDNLLESRLAEE